MRGRSRQLAGLVITVIVIVVGVVIVHNMTSVKQKRQDVLSSQAGINAFHTMLRQFEEKTKIPPDIVYYSGMVTHRLLGAETVQILAVNHKVYNVTVNQRGIIQSIQRTS